MDIRNKKYISDNAGVLEYLNRVMPISDLTETILLEDSLGRKVAEDIYACLDYPSTELSAISGIMFNIKDNINTIEQFKKIENIQFFGNLQNGNNPYNVKCSTEYLTNIPPYVKIGSIGNTVITVEHYIPWLSNIHSKNENYNLDIIKKGEGIIKIAKDYKKSSLVLKKDDIVNNTKKALLRQAGVESFLVYKKMNFAILCVDYDLEDFNKNFELEYIKDCMDSWGYQYSLIKVKPHRNKPTTLSIDDANITTDFKTYTNNIREITKNFDYIVACGLAIDSNIVQLGLLRPINELKVIKNQSINSKKHLMGGCFQIMVGELNNPVRKENIKYYDSRGTVVNQKLKIYEDRAILSYIPGYILDIVLNMHLIVKPTILNKLYQKVFLPEWKIGKLIEDYEFKSDGDYNYKILWAYFSKTTFDENNNIITKPIPEVKIIHLENERPDQLNFMKECNCFIPLVNTENKLKAGDYFYYLEI